jgi:hypothetical protein
MESVAGAVKLMIFIYMAAAAIALVTAWIINLIIFAIQRRKKHAPAPAKR